MHLPEASRLAPFLTLAVLPVLGCRPATPEGRFGAALPALERGEEDRFRTAVERLLEEEAAFAERYAAAVPLDLPEPDPLPEEPRLRILSPRGMVAHLEWQRPTGELKVFWHDLQSPPRPPERLSMRLFQARPPVPGEPDWPADKGALLAENLLAGSAPQGDGSQLFLFGTRHLPPGWLLMEIRDPMSPLEEKVEDAAWFQASTGSGLRREEFNGAKESLRALLDEAGASETQADLVLARLLLEHRFFLATAQLLELLASEGRGTPGGEALLRRAYALLGRAGNTPREPPFRDDAARWDIRLF